MHYLVIISALLFLMYGSLVISTDHMGREFERYGLSKFRTLTGVLEILGGFGSLAGILYPILLVISSGGLCLLMFLGCLTRLKAKDPFIQIIPAFVLMLLNGFIFYDTWRNLSYN